MVGRIDINCLWRVISSFIPKTLHRLPDFFLIRTSNIIRMKYLLLVFIAFASLHINAKEGMWIPSLLKNLAESDMREMGMKITAEDIYSFNRSSLKDAIVHFGGGCTAEMISDQGLLLTNHHCGYGQIQSHSSVENDLLTDGFWAKDRSSELKNSGLTASFIIRIDEVTKEVLVGVTGEMAEGERQKQIAANIKAIGEAAIVGTNYGYIIRPFYFGNQYYMFLTETFRDVRLVGAPPSSVGKFGFDTDNWVWPRHTGDFSMFRIYADKDNKPAEISNNNRPYVPRYSLPISLRGVKPGDFTMMYGFPGYTQEYLTSYAVEYVIKKQNPHRIAMRDISLGIMGRYMASNPAIRIQYAAKQSRISNAWKKWIGQNQGLIRNDAITQKKEIEARFKANANMSVEKYGTRYTGILDEYKSLYSKIEKYEFARDMYFELYYMGPEILRYSAYFSLLDPSVTPDSTIDKSVEKLKKSGVGYFKNYHAPIDRELMAQMLAYYYSVINADFTGKTHEYIQDKFDGDYQRFAAFVFDKSVFSSKEKVASLLEKDPDKAFKILSRDPAYLLAKEIENTYELKVKPKYAELNAQLGLLHRKYMEGLMTLLPNDKKYYPDANSTLRVSYGKVEGYEAADAVVYDPFSTATGILEKRDTTLEFTVPDKLAELIKNKDFGRYADADSTLHVAFIASNHTTGGNSGSPALNAEGQLIGLNFDRTWESTMSDIYYDPVICRNIMVDIRYVLFIVDKYADADHLISEMKLVE
jgi:hypothetical protein